MDQSAMEDADRRTRHFLLVRYWRSALGFWSKDKRRTALDPVSQAELMRLVLERLPQATLVSVAHRAKLEAFHTRKLVLEYQHEGARLVDEDDRLTWAIGRFARFLSSLWNRKKSRRCRT